MMQEERECTDSNTKAAVTVVTEVNPVATSTILSRFITAPIPLDRAERQRLMDECHGRIRANWKSVPPNWATVDAIDSLISKAFTRAELMKLLAEYEATILGGQPA